jgi:hypothetical protein
MMLLIHWPDSFTSLRQGPFALNSDFSPRVASELFPMPSCEQMK